MVLGFTKMEKSGAVSMRLFANWEMDRASTSAVQRIFTLNINRLILSTLPSPLNPLVLTVKLQGYKRNLRTNEIQLSSSSNGSVEMPLDVSFTIHYPHFIKRKRNILQILIQRRRKYKNRPIPGGFKTIYLGMIDLMQLMQQDNCREVLLWKAEDLERQNMNVNSVGKLCFSHCQTSPLDSEDRDRLTKKEGENSDDYSDSDYEDVGLEELQDTPSGRNRNGFESGLKTKMSDRSDRKNIKQKLSKLLRKFKVPDEENISNTATGSIARPPTAKELEALFEELEDMSDSGPELAPDQVSINSNPRPALRPYFTRSKEILPAIYDPECVSDSDADDIDENWSSEENGKDGLKGSKTARSSDIAGGSNTQTTPLRVAQRVSITNSAPLGITPISVSLPHSQTTGSINNKKDSRLLDLDHSNLEQQQMWHDASEKCEWIYGNDECPPFFHKLSLTTTECSTPAAVKQYINHIVSEIQRFCNSNSSNPPVTFVGIAGGDRLVSQVLRAFVDLHKSSGNFLQFLRFIILPPRHSYVGRLLSSMDPNLDLLLLDIYERAESTDPNELESKINQFVSQSRVPCSLPIGEALLQPSESSEVDSGAGQTTFVPFLSEVRVGPSEDDTGSDIGSPRPCDDSGIMGGSPPCSPHVRGDARELNVEYWLDKENAGLPNSSSTPVSYSKKDVTKGSMKTAFRSVIINRSIVSPPLTLTFVKEKRKEKMLQKLGMKKGQKSDPDCLPGQVKSVSRVLCSGTSKHSGLNVFVDGALYKGVKFFQTSAQWQTHMKSFPIALSSPLL